MKVHQENIDQLNAVVKITIQPEDYQANVEKSLRDYSKKATLPGFRPGKVPFPIIKKRFGKSVLAEELNKQINSALTHHIQENKLQVLGNPLPSQSNGDEGDWDNPGDFTFNYDLGLAPDFDVKLSKKDKLEFHLVKIDDELIDRQVNDMARRYGKLSTPQTAGENDLIIAELAELEDDGSVKEGGLAAPLTVSLEFVKDKTSKKALIGSKVGDELTLDPKKLVEEEHDLMSTLKISHEQLHNLKSSFRLTIKDIKHLEPAELNQELFDKILGKDAVSSVEEFTEKIAAQLKDNFYQESNKLFKRNITEQLLAKADLKLPDEFLQRWIKASNERPLTQEQLEAEYPNYAKGLKWQLIENKILQEGDLKIGNEDLLSEAKAIMAAQFARYGIPVDNEEVLAGSAHRLLSNMDELRYVYDQVTERKLMEYIKENINIVEKEVSLDDFKKLAEKGSH